jgi:hypothetical protein
LDDKGSKVQGRFEEAKRRRQQEWRILDAQVKEIGIPKWQMEHKHW